MSTACIFEHRGTVIQKATESQNPILTINFKVKTKHINFKSIKQRMSPSL